MTKSTLTRVIGIFISILTVFQSVLTGSTAEGAPHVLGLAGNNLIDVSATVMFAGIILTAWRQYLSVEIRNGSLIATLSIFLLAVLGGANEWIVQIHYIGPQTSQIIRWGITMAILLIDQGSKTLFPTQGAKLIEEVKKNIGEVQKENNINSQQQ